jgi:hypothetical protein
MKYMIHTHIKRLWYVEDFLISSMIKQGINEDDIVIVLDDKNIGNLKSFLFSLKSILKDESLKNEQGIWHLQDDVLLSSDFKKKSEYYAKKNTIINGFVSSTYNSLKLKNTGKQPLKNSWLSFPCIYIPNRYIEGFLSWIDVVRKEDRNDYKQRYESNRHDDFFMFMYLEETQGNIDVYNLKPNIVDHIDYLIGNSINKPRKEPVTGYYFEDEISRKRLEKELKEYEKIR